MDDDKRDCAYTPPSFTDGDDTDGPVSHQRRRKYDCDVPYAPQPPTVIPDRAEISTDNLPHVKYRTGTGPFMALDLLLSPGALVHQYHHDLESFFWVLVYFCAKFDLASHKLSVFEAWEKGSLRQIGENKKLILKRAVWQDQFPNPSANVFTTLAQDWGKPLRSLLVEIPVLISAIDGLRERCFDLQQANNNPRALAECREKLKQAILDKQQLLTYQDFMHVIGASEGD